MIGPKTPKPTPRQEREAYDACTTRDPQCVRCGANFIQRDHRKNRSQGGRTVLSNLQGLCVTCHVWKTENPAAAVLEGFAVPGWAHPEFWPAWRGDVGSWVVYYDAPDAQGRWWDVITQATADLLMRGDR